MGPRDERLVTARNEMVRRQLRDRGVRDPLVLAAMATVPRERFVRDQDRDLAYADAALPALAGQTISQPLMVGLMLQLLRLAPDDRVLEVGTGTGYEAAILAEMGCLVTSIERLPDLADAARERLDALGYGRHVDVRVGDGSLGAPDGAPWGAIVVAAAAPKVPTALTDQLADGGRLVIPVGSRSEQDLVAVERSGDRLVTTLHGPCVFVPLVGAGGWT